MGVKTMGFRTEESTHQQIESIAEANNRSLASVLEIMVKIQLEAVMAGECKELPAVPSVQK